MKKNLFIVTVIILFITNFVLAANWVQIDEKIYLDESSLSEYNYSSNYDKDLIFSVWEKSLNDGTDNWKELEKIIGKKLWYSKNLFVANCTKKQIATETSVYYDLKGNVAYSFDHNYLNWYSVVPETLGEYEYYLVCSSITPNVPSITTPDKNNIILTPSGTKVKIKYHK